MFGACKGHFHGKHHGIIGAEEAFFFEDVEVIHQLCGVIGTVGIAEAGMFVTVGRAAFLGNGIA